MVAWLAVVSVVAECLAALVWLWWLVGWFMSLDTVGCCIGAITVVVVISVVVGCMLRWFGEVVDFFVYLCVCGGVMGGRVVV